MNYRNGGSKSSRKLAINGGGNEERKGAAYFTGPRAEKNKMVRVFVLGAGWA
jgi:hypothetical protein